MTRFKRESGGYLGTRVGAGVRDPFIARVGNAWQV